MALNVDIQKRLGDFSLCVCIEVRQGVTALFGPSGCGKSVTLACIAGILKPDRGHIELDGETLFDSKRRVNLPPQRRGIGLLFQNYALFPNMTVERNILAGMRKGGHADKKAALRGLVSAFRLDGLESHYPAQLSGGQRQRAALARIFASRPRLLMLDEPLCALDSFLRWQLETELSATLEDSGIPALLVSHDRGEVYRLCQTAIVMEDGRAEPPRGVGELFREPHTRSAAMLSGCKNFSRAKKTGDTSILAVDWNCALECGRPVPEHTGFVGVRAHYIRPAQENEALLHACVERVAWDVFSAVVTLKPDGGAERIRMELPKDEAGALRAGERIGIRFEQGEIMLLKCSSICLYH